MITEDFKKELATLINKHSVENSINMPDYILAEMICDVIETIGLSVKSRDEWMGFSNHLTNQSGRLKIDKKL